MIGAATQAIPVIVGRRPVERDDKPTLAALRHAERTAFMELCRAYADLADIPPRGSDAIWNARDRVSRRTRIWVTASEAYFAALASGIG